MAVQQNDGSSFLKPEGLICILIHTSSSLRNSMEIILMSVPVYYILQKLLDDHEALDNYIKFDAGCLRCTPV